MVSKRVRFTVTDLLLTCALAAFAAGCGANFQTGPSDSGSAVSESEAVSSSTSDSDSPANHSGESAPASAHTSIGDGSESLSPLRGTQILRDGAEPTAEQLLKASEINYLNVGYSLTFDINGLGELLTDSDIHVKALPDVLTGETTYYTVYYYEYTRTEDDGYSTEYHSRLYNTDANLLADWSDMEYTTCVGDWVAARSYHNYMLDSFDDYEGCLLNLRTGEKQDGVYYLSKLGDNCAWASNEMSGTGIVLDQNGDPLFDFSTLAKRPGYNLSITTYGNYIVVNYSPLGMDNYDIYFYTPTGELLGYLTDVTDSYLYSELVMAPYVQCEQVVYNPSLGNGDVLTPIYQNEAVDYFDGEVAILAYDTFRDNPYAYLCDVTTGEIISDRYDSISCESGYLISELEGISSYFIASKDDTIYKLDRDGAVLATATIEDLYGICAYRDAIVCNLENYDGCCLLDTDLNVMIPSGTYRSLYPLTDENDSTARGIWTGTYSINDTSERKNIIRTDGTVLLTGVSDAFQIRYGKIAVTRGQDVGLMDLDMNWIVKYRKNDLTNND